MKLFRNWIFICCYEEDQAAVTDIPSQDVRGGGQETTSEPIEKSLLCKRCVLGQDTGNGLKSPFSETEWAVASGANLTLWSLRTGHHFFSCSQALVNKSVRQSIY